MHEHQADPVPSGTASHSGTDRTHNRATTPQRRRPGRVRAWATTWAKTTGPPKVLAVCAGTPTFIVFVWGIYALFRLSQESGPAGDPSYILLAIPATFVAGLVVWALRTKKLARAWVLAGVLFVVGYPFNRELMELLLELASIAQP
jgi:hypothetical protein